MFRRESGPLASELIREAVAVTRWRWPETPDLGMVTFINREKVRNKQDFGYCYLQAGFKIAGETKGGLLVLQILPHEMPKAQPPITLQGEPHPLTRRDLAK